MPTTPTADGATAPAALVALRWLTERDLTPEQRAALLASVRRMPRPPQALQKLVSPDFIATAGSLELSELVMSDPLIAAKVIATVNSPFYGLRNPVNGIGQAVTFLGMNRVRSICMQYMLAETFKPTNALVQRCFDTIWLASSIASELSARLGKTLNLPDQASFPTQVVLCFVGSLAAATLIPTPEMEKWTTCDQLERTRLEQDTLGLNATEIGSLLMTSWELPPALVTEVGNIQRQLVSPYINTDPEKAPRLALGYLCILLGAQLAMGKLKSLEDYEAAQDESLDTHYLRASLSHPALARLDHALRSPEVAASLERMLGTSTA